MTLVPEKVGDSLDASENDGDGEKRSDLGVLRR